MTRSQFDGHNLIVSLISERTRLRDVLQRVLAEIPVVVQDDPPALIGDDWHIDLADAEHAAVVKAMES